MFNIVGQAMPGHCDGCCDGCEKGFEEQMVAEGESLTSAHLPRLGGLVRASQRAPSEYSLANLYLYRNRHRYRFVDGEHPFIHGITYDGERHVLPLGPIEGSLVREWLSFADCIYPLGEHETRDLAADGSLVFDDREADADYIYDAPQLARLNGAKAKRAQAAKFAEYQPRVERFRSAAASNVLQDWLAEGGRGPGHADARECAEAIDSASMLGLVGITVWLGTEPVAFLLASPPRATDSIVHFAKARLSVPGAYPWMFAHFASQVGTPLLNFEQDLGKPGLAQAKRSLAPVCRSRKFRVRLAP